MATVAVKCRYGKSQLVYKQSCACSGKPCYRCRKCQRIFQLTYRYERNKPYSLKK